MAREIKFRAWDKKSGEFIDYFHILNNGEWDIFSEDEDGYFSIRNGYYLCIMQYTGLKDKNGKEIYEGDIVVKDGYIWFDDNLPNYRGTVEWIYSQWQVVAHCVNKMKKGISDGINEGLNDDGIDEGGNSEWEVIGNIWENPELLETKKCG